MHWVHTQESRGPGGVHDWFQWHSNHLMVNGQVVYGNVILLFSQIGILYCTLPFIVEITRRII